MKKKEFLKKKMEYLGALATGKTEKAADLKKELFNAILERKAQGKRLFRFNFR